MRILLAAVVLALAGGCVTDARVGSKYEKFVAEWQMAHPDEVASEATLKELFAKAEVAVAAEVAKEREEALKKGASAAGNALTGNWIMAVFDLVGLAGLAFGAKGGA